MEEKKIRTELRRRHFVDIGDVADRDGVAGSSRDLQPVGERDPGQRQCTDIGKVVLRRVGGALARDRGILA